MAFDRCFIITARKAPQQSYGGSGWKWMGWGIFLDVGCILGLIDGTECSEDKGEEAARLTASLNNHRTGALFLRWKVLGRSRSEGEIKHSFNLVDRWKAALLKNFQTLDAEEMRLNYARAYTRGLCPLWNCPSISSCDLCFLDIYLYCPTSLNQEGLGEAGTWDWIEYLPQGWSLSSWRLCLSWR